MKRIAVSSLSLATSLFLLCVSSFALNPSEQLTAGFASLDKVINTASATQGQVVSAKLTQTIKTPEGLKLPRGTELIGRVDEVQASHDKSPAKLVLTFDRARLKDGKEIPIKATLIGIASPGTPEEQTEQVAGRDGFDQVPNSSSGTTLHSRIEANSSGTLTRPDKNIRLIDGTELQIAVAPASA